MSVIDETPWYYLGYEEQGSEVIRDIESEQSLEGNTPFRHRTIWTGPGWYRLEYQKEWCNRRCCRKTVGILMSAESLIDRLQEEINSLRSKIDSLESLRIETEGKLTGVIPQVRIGVQEQ